MYAGEAGTQAVVVTLSVTGYNGQVSYDTFSETAGNVLETKNGGYGWSGAWVDNATLAPEPYVGSTSLANFDNYCNDGGNDAAVDMANCGGFGEDSCFGLYREAYRAFPQISSGVLYLGFKLKAQFTGTGKDYGVMLGDGGSFKIKIGKVDASSNNLGIQTTDGISLTSYGIGGAGSEYLILMRYDFASREVKVKGHFANSLTATESWDSTTRTAPAGTGPLNRLTLYAQNGLAAETAGIVEWDDVRIATTWSDLLCALTTPQGYPVVSNVTFHAVDSTNSVTDGTLNSGNFPISVTFYDQYGVRSDTTNAPFFKPNFDLINSSGDHMVQDRLFASTSYNANATVMVGSNATISPVTSVNIPIGTATLRWSAINSNEAYRTDNPQTSNGSNITFSVYDDDVTGPTPTLIFIGANYTIGATQTNITDADLANATNLADIAVRWDDPSGVFLTNSPPFPNTNIGSEAGRVIANWDLYTSNSVTHVTNDFGYDQVFTNFIGANGATSVTTWQQNAFVITNIDFNNVFFLTASAEDEDNDRGTYADPGSNGDPIPWDRTVITNAQSFLSVVDDDSVAPSATSFTLSGTSRGTNIVTGAELSSGSWSITGIVQDAYSGLNVNGTSTNVPSNSPFLRILDPSGAVRLTVILTNSITDGTTNARAVSVSATPVSGAIQGGVWTALVVLTDNDGDRANDALTTTNTITFGVPTFEWDAGGGADRDWSNATNWTADIEPAAIDVSFVNGGYTALVTLAGEVVSNLFVGDNGFDGGSDNGTGTVEQTGGVLGVKNLFTLGESSGDRGTYWASGGALTITGATTIGSAGVGLMTVTGTAAVTSIGDWIVAAGSAGAEDAGSTLTVAGGTALASRDLTVGNNSGASGAVALSGGVLTVTDALNIGNVAGSTGTLSATAGQLNAGGAGGTEHLFVGVAGLGTMAISGVATVTVSNGRDLVIGDAANNGANNAVTLSGGVLTVGDSIEIGDASAARGTLTVSGGLGTATNVNIGNAGGSTGTVTVSSGRLTAVGDLVVGRTGLGALTISGGAVTAGVVTVGDFTGGSGSTLTVAGGRLDTTGTGDLDVDYAATLNVSSGTVGVDMINFATNGISTLNLSGGLITLGNDFNVGAGFGATGIVNQSGGAVQIAAGQPLVLGGQGTTGNRNGRYVITNGTITIGAGSDNGDIELGDTDAATGRGVFHVLGAAPSVTVGDDLAFSSQNNGELQVTLWDGAIAAINVGDDVNLNGTLTVSNIGAVAAGSYMIITNAQGGTHSINGAFSTTNWSGSVTGRVVVSAHQVDLVFGPVMSVLGTNGAAIADGDTTPTTADGTLFSNIVANTSFSHTFTITNVNATYALSLTNNPAVSLSGATNFIITSQPASSNLNGLTATTFTLQFAPDVVGVYTTTVSIANNDTQQNPYDFRVVGHAVLESEPTLASSNLIFTAVSNAQMTVSWNSGNGANRLLVARVGGSVTNLPVDGVGYTANSVHSNGAAIATGVYAVYNASGTNVTVTGLYPGTTYSFALFEYNGAAGGANYLTSSFTTGTQATVTFAPVITEGTNANVTMSENGSPVPFSLTLHATDADTPYGDVIQWSVLAAPFYGSAAASGTGGTMVVSYAPARYFSGSDYFIVMVYDQFNNIDLITVNVTVTAVNPAGNVFYLFE